MQNRNIRIGWIGTGVMGFSMCSRLMDQGYTVSVHNRTKVKAAGLLDRGAEWSDDPAGVGRNSDIVFTILGYPADVRSVILEEGGLLAAMQQGSVLVDMTTSEPSLAEEIGAAGTERGVSAVDAPVSGGDVGAKNGTLAIMAGGDREAFERVMPLFKIMGENISLMGGHGAGQHTKMCNQTLIASTMIGVVESLLYAERAGLNPEEVINVIGKGAAASWSINNLGPRIVKGNFDPGFYIKHFVKDMGIALKEAERMNLSLPGLSLAKQFYIAAMAQGYEKLGTQGLYKVCSQLNGF
ncbi:MAG: NAD(P)-dependent oxidoreductase [Spirochaetia bacterium]